MITCERTTSADLDFQKLVVELDRHLAVINGAENDFFAQYNKIDHIEHVVVAYKDRTPVGCGAMKEYEKGVIEIKRMFVPAEMRGRGIASYVLNELETWAKELNYKKSILETSEQLMPAIKLYTKTGYNIVPNYGQYKDVESSVCFEKIFLRYTCFICRVFYCPLHQLLSFFHSHPFLGSAHSIQAMRYIHKRP